MEIEKFKKKYFGFDLYKQAAAVKPLYIGFPYQACFDFAARGKKIALSYSGMAGYFKNDYMEVYFPLTTMERITSYYVTGRKKPFSFLKALKEKWDKQYVPHFLSAINRLETINLHNLDDASLLSEFMRFSKIYHAVWRESIFHDAFDAQGDAILHNALAREKADINPQDLHTLTSPETHSWMQKERESLLALAAMARKNPALKRSIIKTDLGKIQRHNAFYCRLLTHRRQFHWMHNDYAVIQNLGPSYFVKELAQFVTHPKKADHEKHDLAAVARIHRAKARLLKRYGLSPVFQDALNALMLISAWRDDRKTYNQMANAVLYRFAREFPKRTRFSKKEIENFFWWEIPQIFHPSADLLRMSKKRESDFFITAKPNQYAHMYYGKAAKGLNTFLTAHISGKKGLRGRTAFPGIVRGKIKIIRNQGEFKKMKPGDILVAANTRPEYIPIMKIAGAIIAEEGGLTCHAAIVSRELKKPCIVGAQGILAKLKDNDTVEVDADRGEIKLI